MKPADAMTEEKRIELLAALLMTQPWTLVACGLGEITGEDLAKRLLSLRPNK
jgi:Ran GTPase-activating protein (RanGAP) involved in mRNA processing and transport